VSDPGGHPTQQLVLQTLGRVTAAARHSEIDSKRASITVLIADDHPLFREALRKLLELDDTLRVVGEAGNGDETIRLARELRPDVVLLDLRMPGTSGTDVLRELSAFTPPVRTLVLTAEVSASGVVDALAHGARGIVLKESTSDLLFKSIRAVAGGEYWVRRDSVADLVDKVRNHTETAAAAPAASTFGLTPRELEIVATVVAGYTNDDIARKLSISTKTVKHHLTNIFAKLGVSNRLELALLAVQRGLPSE
jgi:two-component system nitrate/nitrite response regulator NarL